MPFFLLYFIEERFIHRKMPQLQVYNSMNFVTTTTKIWNPSLSRQSPLCLLLAIHTPTPAHQCRVLSLALALKFLGFGVHPITQCWCSTSGFLRGT